MAWFVLRRLFKIRVQPESTDSVVARVSYVDNTLEIGYALWCVELQCTITCPTKGHIYRTS